MVETYTPSRFLQNNIGSVHHKIMFQGPLKSSSIPHHEGLCTAYTNSGPSTDSGDQRAMQLFRCLIPQAMTQGPSIILRSYHRKNILDDLDSIIWGVVEYNIFHDLMKLPSG